LVLLYVLRQVFGVFLTVFAGILLAVFLDSIAKGIEKRTRLRHGPALAVGIVLFIGFMVLVVWAAGAPVGAQIGSLIERVPGALETLQEKLSTTEWGQRVLGALPEPGEGAFMTAGTLKGVGAAFSATTSVVVDFFIILIVGFYLAADPGLYVRGIVRFFPKDRRRRAREVSSAIARALRWWLVGRISSMVVVGGLTALGLWIAGVPLPLALGFIAGLLSFIPLLGPIFGAVPAILVALAESPSLVLYTVIVFAVVQILESYLVTPLIQQRAVSIPPALLLTAQIVLSVLFGAMGMLLATPIAVALIVLVQMVYIQDILGDRIKVLGEK
jgi:predicted PurR-regulated permease PerM